MVKILVAVLFFPLVVFAKGEGMGPCKADAEKFCKGVEPGQGRIVKCLKEHEAELSADCKAKHEAKKEMRQERREHRRERAHQMKEACGADKDKFCRDVKPGKGAVMDCLKANETQLSESCKTEMAKMKK